MLEKKISLKIDMSVHKEIVKICQRQTLINEKNYPVSEFIRTAIREKLKKDSKTADKSL